jgi:hypothetical protein
MEEQNRLTPQEMKATLTESNSAMEEQKYKSNYIQLSSWSIQGSSRIYE